MKKNEFFDSIQKGLEEAIDDAKSNKTLLKKTKRSFIIMPVKKYSAKEVKRIRTSVHMTQSVFASYMGVSLKTVEAWESGKNTPCGSSSRLLTMFEMNKNLANEYPFIQEMN